MERKGPERTGLDWKGFFMAVVRRNVSIPSSLEQRMRDFSARHQVNWSQIAADAFEDALIRLRKDAAAKRKAEEIYRKNCFAYRIELSTGMECHSDSSVVGVVDTRRV